MKRGFIFILTAFIFASATGQTFSSDVDIVKLFSPNKQYYLKSIPYDDEDETLYGKTLVYKTSNDSVLYRVNRYFQYTYYPNEINLSNNGQIISYINNFYSDDKIAEKRNLTFYKNGNLLKSYTRKELTLCDDDKEDCFLLYKNKEVMDRDSVHYYDNMLHNGFKAGTSEEEKFANNFNVFANDDTLYIINKNKEVLRFYIPAGALLSTSAFELNYNYLRSHSRINDVALTKIKSPSYYDMPDLLDGKKFNKAMASHIRMKTTDIFEPKQDHKYKSHFVVIDCIIDRDGKATIDSVETDQGLPRDAIISFINSARFDMSKLPPELDHWRIDEAYVYFRNSSAAKAKKEKRDEKIENQEAYIRRLTLDSINGFYIPKNLEECFTQLDLLLSSKVKTEIKELSSKDETIRYHLGMGTWLRNSWGLWGGSRLQAYFSKRGIYDPESMTPVILECYYDWLNGNKESWKQWEIAHPEK